MPTPDLDDDTSAGKVTQGGRDRGHGRGWAWLAAGLLALAIAGGLLLSERRAPQVRHGLTVVSHGL